MATVHTGVATEPLEVDASPSRPQDRSMRSLVVSGVVCVLVICALGTLLHPSAHSQALAHSRRYISPAGMLPLTPENTAVGSLRPSKKFPLGRPPMVPKLMPQLPVRERAEVSRCATATVTPEYVDILAEDEGLLEAAECAREALESKSLGGVPLSIRYRALLQLELAAIYEELGYVDEEVTVLQSLIAEQNVGLGALSSQTDTNVAIAKVNLAHVLVDGRGQHNAALELYDDVTEARLNAWSLWVRGCVFSFQRDFEKAIRSFAKALQLVQTGPDPDNNPNGDDLVLALHVASAASTDGLMAHIHALNLADSETAMRVKQGLPSFMESSWDYVRKLPGFVASDPSLYAFTYDMLRLGMSAARQGLEDGLASNQFEDGLVLECGVLHGKTIRMIGAHWPNLHVHGFDTFEASPEAPLRTEAAPYSPQKSNTLYPLAPKNVEYHKGFFSETLPTFLKNRRGPIRFLHVGVNPGQNPFANTQDIFEAVHERIVPGTIIVFAGYVNTPGWKEEEFGAFQEAVSQYGWSYEYLGISLVSKQAVIRILDPKRAPGRYVAAGSVQKPMLV